MAKHKTSELSGALLDAAVAKAERRDVAEPVYSAHGDSERDWSPSTEWADGGPIIQRERIDVSAGCNAGEGDLWDWCAFCPSMRTGDNGLVAQYGETPLMAAMRAYVASKFGDEVKL